VADKRIKLEVIVTDNGTLKVVGKDLKGVRKEADKSSKSFTNVSNAANKTKRNLEGVANRANNTGKDFSRMSQGMGGLVQAYATVAANVFALSSAFLVLRRTADLSSMIKSAEDFSGRFGVSVTAVTRQLQKATGGAFSFADALPIVNKAISAGVPIDKMEALAIAATKAAQTFGGTATEALNRFISASQRGRVEIIQTLGIVIKTEDAYERYGASIGKTAQELTAFDRQQAILNATIEASQNVFDGVKIDANPFQQLLTTMVDLKDTVGVFITDSLTPFINTFNKSKAAAAAFMAIIVGAVAGRIFPAISDQLGEMQKRSFESTQRATAIMKKARNDQSKIILETGVKQNKLTKDQLLKRSQMFDSYFSKLTKEHKTFGKSILDEEKKINVAILNERRAAITRELNLRAKGQGSVKYKGVSTAALENERNRLILLTKETNNARAATQKLTAAEQARNSAFKRGAAGLSLFTTSIRANTVALKAQIGTGFQRSFAQTQQSFFLGVKMMGRSWSNFVKIAIAESKSAQLAFAAFARAVGRSAGLIAGAFAKALSAFSTITFVVSTGLFLWDKFGDKIRGITPEVRATQEAVERFKESLEESNRILQKGIAAWGDKAVESLKDVIDILNFVGGSFESLSTNITNLFTDLIAITEGLSFEQYVAELDKLRKAASETTTVEKIVALGPLETFGKLLSGNFKAIRENVQELTPAAEEATQKLKEARDVVVTLAKEKFVPALADQFTRTAQFAQEAGINIENAFIKPAQVLEEKLEPKLGSIATKITELAQAGDSEGISKIIDDLGQNSEVGARNVFLLQIALAGFYRDVSGAVTAAARSTATSLKQLTEAGTNFQTYVLGLDKLQSQKSPYKEIFAEVINVENAVKDLIKNKETLSSTSLDEIFAAKGAASELEYIRALLGEEVTDLESAEAAAAKLKATIQSQLEAQIIGSLKLKTVQEQLNAAKAQNIRDDRDRIFQVAQINALEIAQVSRKADIAAAERDAAEAVLIRLEATSKLSDFERARRTEEIRALDAQVEALNNQEQALIENNKVALEGLQINNEILETRSKLLDILSKASTINRKLVGNLPDYLSLSKDIYIASRAQLKIQKDQIEIEKERIKLTTREGSDLQNRLLGIEEAKLLLLKQQTAELERQQESRRAIELERGLGDEDPVSIFSERGMVEAARFFSRALQDEISKIKSTFEIIGRGFAKTMFDTFDTIIDNLLEGAKDFGETVRETLKASLREVIGEALKNRIRESLIQMFEKLPIFKKFFGKEQDPSDEAVTTVIPGKLDTQITLLEQIAYNTAMAAGGGAAPGMASAMNSTFGALFPELGGLNKQDKASPFSSPVPKDDKKTLTVFGDINKNQKELVNLATQGNNIMEQPTEVSTVGTVAESPALAGTFSAVGGLITAATQDNKAGIIQALFAIAAQIVASNTASGFAMGGIISGGTSKITALADGGIVTGPSVALMGEGKYNEAVVPLPNNREIPVEMRGGGETVNINTEQHFDFTNANADTVAQLRAEARMIEERTFNRVFNEVNKGGKYAKIVGRRG
jgi:hypothetical protein